MTLVVAQPCSAGTLVIGERLVNDLHGDSRRLGCKLVIAGQRLFSCSGFTSVGRWLGRRPLWWLDRDIEAVGSPQLEPSDLPALMARVAIPAAPHQARYQDAVDLAEAAALGHCPCDTHVFWWLPSRIMGFLLADGRAPCLGDTSFAPHGSMPMSVQGYDVFAHIIQPCEVSARTIRVVRRPPPIRDLPLADCLAALLEIHVAAERVTAATGRWRVGGGVDIRLVRPDGVIEALDTDGRPIPLPEPEPEPRRLRAGDACVCGSGQRFGACHGAIAEASR